MRSRHFIDISIVRVDLSVILHPEVMIIFRLYWTMLEVLIPFIKYNPKVCIFFFRSYGA